MTAPPSPASLMWQRAGSRSMTTRGTRRPTTSTSPCRRASASSPTVSSATTTTKDGATRFDWHAPEPMASYLATIDIGEWDVRQWTTASGLPVYDAVDPDLLSDPELGPSINSSLARQGEIVDVLVRGVRSLPVLDGRGDRRRPARPLLRARDADQTGLLAVLLARRRRQRGRPRAGPPVVWRPCRTRAVAGHLAQRGLGDVCRVDLGRARGLLHPSGRLRLLSTPLPEDDPFWAFVIGQPPADDLFGNPVYFRGAMTLQVLRNRVGDAAFLEIAQSWVQERGGGTGTTAQFIALAERVSGAASSTTSSTHGCSPTRSRQSSASPPPGARPSRRRRPPCAPGTPRPRRASPLAGTEASPLVTAGAAVTSGHDRRAFGSSLHPAPAPCRFAVGRRQGTVAPVRASLDL